jgi:hypothetical protein
MSVQCKYRKNGKSCQAYSVLDSKYCFAHDPASAGKRAEARKKGGLHRRVIKRTQHEYQPIKSVEDVNIILESAINEACSLESSQSKLRTLAYLCQIALKGQELGNLEERVNALEKNMN